MLISFASIDASDLLIVPLPSTSNVSKSVAANAADDEARAISAKPLNRTHILEGIIL